MDYICGVEAAMVMSFQYKVLVCGIIQKKKATGGKKGKPHIVAEGRNGNCEELQKVTVKN